MPFPERVLSTPFQLSPLQPKVIDSLKPDAVLDHVYQQSLKGVLVQLAAITAQAHELFSNLYDESKHTLERCVNIGKRVQNLDAEIRMMDDKEIAARNFSKTEATEAQSEPTLFIFQRDSRPLAVQARYSSALAMPYLASFDVFTEPGTNCAAKYSNPNFFIEKWVESEKKRQEAAAERMKKKRQARQEKKKKKMEKEGENEEKQRIEVASVMKKRYNAQGAEFDGSDFGSPATISRAGNVPKINFTTVKENAQDRDSGESRKTPPLPPRILSSDVTSPAYAFSEYPSSSGPRITSALPPITRMTAAVPPAPIAPPPVAALPPSVPAPRIPAPQVAAAQVVEKKPAYPSQSESLLEQIRMGKALKKVVINEKKGNEDAGGLGEIKKLLERRKFIEAEAEEESDDDEWR